MTTGGRSFLDVLRLLYRLRWPALASLTYSVGVAAANHIFFADIDTIAARTHGLIGLLLGFMVVFRTNTAYDRWWEARKLWGQLANDCRNLCIKISVMHQICPEDAYLMGEQLARFARTLKNNLQGDIDAVPARIAILVRELITRWRRDGRIDGYDLMVLDRHAVTLMDVAGSCDRIRRTPIPHAYLALIRGSIFFYLLTLPWGLVEEFNFWTIPVCVLITLFMTGLEAVAENIEDPFGNTEDDLPMEAVCAGLETSLRNIVAGGTGRDGAQSATVIVNPRAQTRNG